MKSSRKEDKHIKTYDFRRPNKFSKNNSNITYDTKILQGLHDLSFRHVRTLATNDVLYVEQSVI